MLGREGVTPEWESWPDACSPHARLVWRSRFPSILQKCIWYALTVDDMCQPLVGHVGGVGDKGVCCVVEPSAVVASYLTQVLPYHYVGKDPFLRTTQVLDQARKTARPWR